MCEEDQVPASEVPKNQRLYNSLVDSFSMRGFVASAGVTAHDHFFDAFVKFGGTDPHHTGEWVDDVAARGAGQNIQYLELMVTPIWHRLNTITNDLTWREDLKSLEGGRCGKPDKSPACDVETRYIYQVFRSTPKQLVLAQALFGFQLASVDPRVVRINLVGGEDDYAAMADYADHMRIFEGPSQHACWRACSGTRAAGGALLPRAAGGGSCRHRPDRPRRRRDV